MRTSASKRRFGAARSGSSPASPTSVPGCPARDPAPTIDAEAVLARAASLRWQTAGGLSRPPGRRACTPRRRPSRRGASCAARRKAKFDVDRTLDRLLTSRLVGLPAHGPHPGGRILAHYRGCERAVGDDRGRPDRQGASAAPPVRHLGGMPWWLSGFLFDGVYLATAWVVSVMLPPMAIFFPIFTLLEDFGYLPRVAFNLDRMFQKVGAHGKQALTMCMGFGCNAAGVVATRVIDSPRERLVAIITNNFSLCNGRWPTQILIATIFLGTLAPAGLASLDRCGRRCRDRAARHRFHVRDVVAAHPHRAQGRSHQLQPRAAAVSAAADSPDALHVAGRSHPDRALARGGVRGAGRRGHLAHLEHPSRRHQPGRALHRLADTRSGCWSGSTASSCSRMSWRFPRTRS